MLTSVPDCDTMLAIATSEKDALVLRKLNLEDDRRQYGGNSVEIEAELKAVISEIAGLEAMIPALPEGTTKQNNIIRLKQKQTKQAILEKRKGNYGAFAILEKEYDISCLEKDIAEADALIAAINDRKAKF